MTTINEMRVEIKRLKKEMFNGSRLVRKQELSEYLDTLRVMKTARDEYIATREATLCRMAPKPKKKAPAPPRAPSVSIEDGKVIVSFQSDKTVTFN